MGWVSTLEDTVERLADAVHMLSEVEASSVQDSATPKETLESLVYRAHCVIQELQGFTAIATDPEISMAEEYAKSRKEISDLKSDIQKLQKTCLALKTQLDRERSRADNSEKRAREAIIERNRGEKRLERILSTAPKTVYDAYPPPRTPRK